MYHGHYAYAPAQQRMRTTTLQLSLHFLAIAALLCVSALSAANTPVKTVSEDVSQFKEWRVLLSKGDHDAWKNYLPHLQGKPLFPYMQYLQLSAELGDLDTETLANAGSFERAHAFLEVWPELHVSDNLKRQWLRRLGKEQNWQALLAQEIDSPPTDIQCLRLQALYETESSNDMREAALDRAKLIWLKGKSQPSRCDKLFEILQEQNRITDNDYRKRIENAVIAGNLSLARWLLKKSSGNNADLKHEWLSLRSDPSKLSQYLEQPVPAKQRRLVIKGMHWLAGSNPDLAVELWPKFVNHAKPSRTEQQALWRRFALKAARENHPLAEQWLNQAVLAADDDYAWGWRMRAALLAENWPKLAELAAQPKTGDRKTDQAIAYWGALAQKKLGNKALAKSQWQQIAGKQNWYSYLAADQLGQAYKDTDQIPESDPVNRALLLSYIEARRARDLFHASADWLARGEWSALLKKIPRELRQEAALFAHELGWASMATRTQMVYTQVKPDEIVFPIPWGALVHSAADQHSIAPSHIWSQMRAESLFMQDVSSSAGAIGLMQLMPATARAVGKDLKLKNWRRLPLQDPATNIQLGSRYIAEMLEKFNDKVPLAAAAYNAGPHRVERWLEKRPYMDASRWVELIPFTETRGYVQRSLYFHTMYDRRLKGKASRISDLLGSEEAQVAKAEGY